MVPTAPTVSVRVPALLVPGPGLSVPVSALPTLALALALARRTQASYFGPRGIRQLRAYLLVKEIRDTNRVGRALGMPRRVGVHALDRAPELGLEAAYAADVCLESRAVRLHDTQTVALVANGGRDRRRQSSPRAGGVAGIRGGGRGG